MRRELLGIGRWTFYGLGLLGALLLLGAAPTPDTPEASSSGGVQVPVVLDGVRYEPEVFNRLWADLNRRGIYLCFTFARDGTFVAFSTKEACDDFLQKEWGLPPVIVPSLLSPPLRVRVEGTQVWVEPLEDADAAPSPPADGSGGMAPQQLCPLPDFYWSRNWEHILCQGWALNVSFGSQIGDLRQIPRPCAGSWNDCISSAQAPAGIRQLILWEHIHFQGNYFPIPAGWTAPDLRAFGWNDRVSSLYAQP
ncbi:MAG: hypothetical protein NZM16_12780 [Thermoflexus sp.]|uniref:hypothetical protein n=1 Tax=Thermoflexus sp. TaxID=1969742 RepID=UPI0025D42BF1|nr:hypothetical protein [Thermoflexus sp.]MCS6964903.1 hypothetical protein [Thermoflexus sp.]MDW8183788.1 hypothetical protein [Anaerolineae bacterium]